MPFTTRKMPSFEGVAAGQTATLRLPIGRTYNQIIVTYGGATLAQLNAARLVANGEIIQRWTELTKLDDINQFDGRAAAAGTIVLDLERYGLITRAGKEVTALGTGITDRAIDPNPVTTLALEIDIDAAAVAPTLSAKAKQSPAQVAGVIKKVKEFTYNAGAAGEFEISDLPKKDLINRVIFGNHVARVYTQLVVERDNFIVFERTVAENEAFQTDGVRVPQAGYVVYDPTEDGYASEGLVTLGVSDLRFKVTVTNAGVIPVTVEYIAPLEA